MAPPLLTVRLASGVVLPTGPANVLLPLLRTVRAYAPLMDEPKLIEVALTTELAVRLTASDRSIAPLLVRLAPRLMEPPPLAVKLDRGTVLLPICPRNVLVPLLVTLKVKLPIIVELYRTDPPDATVLAVSTTALPKVSSPWVALMLKPVRIWLPVFSVKLPLRL